MGKLALTLRQLEIFLAVAETGHVTSAAKRIHLTQSAVSMAISEMENILNGPLFDRQGKKLILNDRGRFLLPYAREIVNKVRNIELLLSEPEGELVGHLHVGASSTIGNYVMPYVVSAFTREHPKVYINLVVGNSRQIEQQVEEGVLDIGFIEGLVHSNKIESQEWLTDRLNIIANPQHPLCQKKELSVHDLVDARWIMREEGSGTAEIFKNTISKYISNFEVFLELGHTEAIKKAVEAGMGLSCLSALTVCREVENGWLKILHIPELEITRQLLIIIRKDKLKTNLLREFISFCNFIKDCCQASEICLTSPYKLLQLLEHHQEMVV